ncbi:shikimate dehydrogenase [Amycolatopsis sacchari]|uniref:shikimate dehydrogenase n=1 Tax=Amycolatopsis sacchari TaxID=115433 RepID=UPI003D72A977
MISSDSHLIGLVGTGIGPSLTPALHEHEAAALGLRYLYRLLDLDALGLPPAAVGEVLAAARLTGFTGLNVTHPVKQLVIEHLDDLSPDAAALGAVNTVVFRDGKAIGHNTDVSGFARSVGAGLADAPLDHVVLIGAGGAGVAVAHALLTLGAGEIRVVDTDRSRAGTLAAHLRRRFGADRARRADDLATALRDADGLVHATPTGMREHPGSAVPPELLRPEVWVADVVYRPLDTELLTTARARGCRVLDGGRMAVFQAADAFRLFTGLEPDADRMLRHFDSLAREDAHVPN